VLILRKKGAWWLAVAPELLAEALPAVQTACGQPGFPDSLISGMRAVLANRYEIRPVHALLFVPPERPRASPNPTGRVVRAITADERPDNVPKESVEAGTAFGLFVGGTLACWAEATPLPTVTNRFGVMLVGIETAEGFRRRGYACAALAALTEHVVGIGRTPLYGCSARNTAEAAESAARLVSATSAPSASPR